MGQTEAPDIPLFFFKARFGNRIIFGIRVPLLYSRGSVRMLVCGLDSRIELVRILYKLPLQPASVVHMRLLVAYIVSRGDATEVACTGLESISFRDIPLG